MKELRNEGKKTKRYEKYKDSGIPWIGEIPAHWEVKKLKYEFKFITGFTPPSGKNEYYENGTHVWINISDMNKKYIDDSEKKITDKAIEDFNPQIVPRGSLLYSFKLTVGKTAFVLKDCYTNEAIFSILPSKDCNLDFFYYALPEQVIKNANENIYGAKILNQELIKNAYLIIPPKDEQSLIADYLDRKTAEIDELIAKKERLLELYEEEKKAVINKAVTKGINPNVKMKDSGIPWLGEIPEHWEVKKLKYIVQLHGGNGFPVREQGSKENGFPFFKVSDINDSKIFVEKANNYVSIETVRKYNWNIIPPYSLIAAKIGEALKKNHRKITSLECIIDNNCIGIEPINIHYKYNYYLHLVIDFTWFVNPGAVPSISVEQYKNFFIPIPNNKEQESIVNYIDKSISIINSKIEKTEKIIELLKEYKTSLISEVITGKMKVTED